MFEPRGRSLRYGLGAAVLVLALLDAFALVHLVGSQERLRRRASREAWQAVWDARPRLQQSLAEAAAPDRATAEEIVRAVGARELELFDPDGKRLFSHPGPAPVAHALSPASLRRVLSGEVLCLGPVSGASPRLLTYASVSIEGRPSVARFAAAAPDLVEDLQEGRGLVLGHAVSLGLLAVIAGVAFFPRLEREAPHPGRVLDTYQEAMGLLRARGERLEQQIRDSAPLVRAGELTSGIAHEVRNGLGTIGGYARLIERAGASDDVTHAAQAIRSECETLEAVVRRFVDFVKDEELHPAAFDPRRLLSRVAAREERARPGRPIEVASDAAAVQADEEMLERAIENLVRNARDAAGPDGRVRVSCTPVEGGVAFVVSDDGPGLSDAERSALRPFYTTKPGGLGLGLAMVHKIASLHGGVVTMLARQPRGLEVRLFVPERTHAPSVTEGSSGADHKEATGDRQPGR